MGRRIAFISDIHGNIKALEAVLQDLDEKGISSENIYCLGDLVGYGPRPNETIEFIKKYNIQSILGNYDEAVGFYLPTCGCNIESENDRMRSKNSLEWTAQHTTDENKEFLRNLEEQISLEIEGYTVLLTHASPYSINDYVYESDTEKQEEIAEELDEDIVIFGHTHYPYYKKIENKIFINAGSVGRPKDGDNRACYCILELGEDISVEFIRIPYDIEKVAKEIEGSALLDVFAEVLRTGRDIK
ncbi:putative phosphoesterase [Anaerosolibacter carboniphilus]|uniref:Phosphoesterase n=1 Tax=Anaerosolibacter carboniphilus TaxID=1417629 RepID=A0A841KMN5_9FIRM|nr:YfcE family phosphodiesterase [Anaerosolibacter carboniphilus]MBB6215054.1 putative phosphoesterase [Anaerosolibacter carboniphilus]